ncbi:MAG: ComEA family DNA-binding protein [Chloroflexi bacterium]|nr:ComEA family DNA-binding protein [Chloroflexota bacterium]
MRVLVQLTILFLIIAALGGGVFTLVRQSSPGFVEVVLPTSTPQPEIKVYVNGAVNNPGVYLAYADDRLEDVLVTAGGLTEDADPMRVNLALRVTDEAHFFIPRIGDVIPTELPVPGKININTASVDELETLPGIGEVTANTIVEYREQNGLFAREEDLLLKPGIGPKTLEDLREFITVY